MDTVTCINVTYLTILCPQNALKTQIQPSLLFQIAPVSNACEEQTPMRKRWVWLRSTVTLLPWVIIQVSGSKYTLISGNITWYRENKGASTEKHICYQTYLAAFSLDPLLCCTVNDMLRLGSLDGYWILWRSIKRAVLTRISGTAFGKL